MGSRTPDGDGLGPLREIIADVGRRLKLLETPTGTSKQSLVDQVKVALANITTTVTAAIGTLSYTKAEVDALAYTKTEVDSRIAAPPSSVSISGALTASGIATVNAGVISTDARSRVLVTGLASIWADGSGRFGINPSARRYKKYLATWTPDIARLLELRSVLFNWVTAVEPDPLLPVAEHKHLGFIAEEVLALGFPEFVFYDDDGLVQGLNYDRMVVALLELAKWEHAQNDARMTAIESRLESLS